MTRAEGSAGTIVIGVVGNPNCGKSTLFNALTGARQEIGNWPGVTVEKKFGSYREGNRAIEVVDLPGVYSLGATFQISEDERIARDFVLAGGADVIVNIVDGSNLERNLYLTTQLLEMRVPMMVVLNMMDIAARRGLEIDMAELSLALGCPVMEIVATRGTGIAAVKRAIVDLADHPRIPAVEPRYGGAVDRGVEAIAAELERMGFSDPRWRALKLIEGDSIMTGETGSALETEVIAARKATEEEFGDDADIIIADARFSFVTGVIERALKRPNVASRTLSDRIDRIVLNRFLGIPIFLAMMYVMFVFTISIGGSFIDFFDQAFEAVLVSGGHSVLAALGLPEWLVVLIADGIGGGIQTVATFVPVIAFLYLFLSFLEDSGYMARAAFVMDRAMRAIGLPGKSFVPLIVGFGCNVPAIMATRTLDSRRDRILTIMMAPFMSCGARLPVFALFAAAFFPTSGQNVVFGLYLIGLLAAVGTGLLLKSTALKGDVSPFIMELPPYHIPLVTTVALRAWDRLNSFIFRCGKLIVPIVMFLTFLNAVGTDGSFGNQNSEKSALSAIGRTITPVFHPMGMRDDNWPAAVGVFTGVLAKEAVVGTLNALYSQLGGASQAQEAERSVVEKVAAAFATIPANLRDALGGFADPLKLNVGYTAAGADAADTLKVNRAAFSAMTSRFDGAVGAFAYLLMVLLYVPCVASVSAINHEIGWRWTAFAAAWTLGLGWSAAVVFYQVARFDRAPTTALMWIAICLGALVAAALALRGVGAAASRAHPPEGDEYPAKLGGAAS